MKDELMNVKIKFTEQSQTVAELKQEISRLETKVWKYIMLFLLNGLRQRSLINFSFVNQQNSEILAEGELRSNMDDSDRVRDLQDKVADLKAEVKKEFVCFLWQIIRSNEVLFKS